MSDDVDKTKVIQFTNGSTIKFFESKEPRGQTPIIDQHRLERSQLPEAQDKFWTLYALQYSIFKLKSERVEGREDTNLESFITSLWELEERIEEELSEFLEEGREEKKHEKIIHS